MGAELALRCITEESSPTAVWDDIVLSNLLSQSVRKAKRLLLQLQARDAHEAIAHRVPPRGNNQ
eukprot:7694199-Prorocentrum_lima.AAC.1